MIMKPDHLEERLRELPERDLPEAWREEILRAARGAIPHENRASEVNCIPWWRAWLWPCPAAWVGVATAWCVILALHFVTARTAQTTASQNAPPPVPVQVWMAFRDPNQLLSDSPSPRGVVPRRAPPAALPQPHTWRQRLTFTV